MSPRPYEAAFGTHTGDGNAKVLTPGFLPKFFRLDNVTDRISQEKHAGMLATETLQTVAAGTRTLDTGSLITFGNPSDPKVTIAAGANVSAKVYHWFALY